MDTSLILADLRQQFGQQSVLYPEDVAALLGKTVGAVASLRHRGGFPLPVTEVGGRPAVSIYDVADWLGNGSKTAAKTPSKAPPLPPPANRRQSLGNALLGFQMQRDFIASLCRETEALLLEWESEDAATDAAETPQTKSGPGGPL